LFFHHSPIGAEWLGGHTNPAASGPNFHLAWAVFENAIVNEYIPFIVLLFTLYTIAGGIRIDGNLKAKPLTNTIILAIGGSIASFVGTTGAAMLLIRLLLETNKLRRHKVHTVVFFIFIVCNCGGLLTPLGDPPLFLGYLRGVNFWFPLLYLWGPWLLVNGLLLVTYFLWDTFIAYPHESQEDIARDECAPHSLKITGYMPNVLLLFGVILAVLFLDPSKTIFGWHPWMYFREMVMLGLVFLSLTLGCKEARAANTFCYAAIAEVAALFFGIFICMQAPLQILHVYGPDLGIETPMQYFWISGTLAMWLDNAPTYVVFFETACTFPLAPEAAAAAQSICGVPICVDFLIAVSLASVFMGAMTYIGNGPNFMVKAIAENSGVKMPSFFGFMGYSCLVVLPILIVMSWFFLR
jgi:Na+/H+ antiporter NhaD/arsenite permease-like protein